MNIVHQLRSNHYFPELERFGILNKNSGQMFVINFVLSDYCYNSHWQGEKFEESFLILFLKTFISYIIGCGSCVINIVILTLLCCTI